MVPAEGFEPTTSCSEDKRSNPLSYAGITLISLVYLTQQEKNLLVPRAGFEPTSLAPEASILSVELTGLNTAKVYQL